MAPNKRSADSWLLRSIDPRGVSDQFLSSEGLSARGVERLLNKATSHRVLPIVLQNFAFPQGETFGLLRKQADADRIKQLALSAMLNQHAAGILNVAAGLPVAIVKGQVFAEAIYPKSALRPFTDIDLLVSPVAMGKLQEALLALGFAEETRDARRLEAKWVHRNTGALLELHGNLVHSSRMREVFSLKYDDVGDQPYSRSTQLAVAVAHGAMHYFAWLRHIVDVCQAARSLRAADEARFERIVVHTGLRLPAVLALTLAGQVMREGRCQEIAGALSATREGLLLKIMRGGAILTATSDSWIVYNSWRRFILRELLRFGARVSA